MFTTYKDTLYFYWTLNTEQFEIKNKMCKLCARHILLSCVLIQGNYCYISTNSTTIRIVKVFGQIIIMITSSKSDWNNYSKYST